MRQLGRFRIPWLALTVLGAAGLLAHSCARAEDGSKAADLPTLVRGDWIGKCEQTTDGKKSPVLYFSLQVREAGKGSFRSELRYFRWDSKSRKMVPSGETEIATTLGSDGTGKSTITGTGQAYVDGSFKPEKHRIEETFKLVGEDRLEGSGTGTMSVSGMAFGAGKNGKVSRSGTVWSLSEGTLTIKQQLSAVFKFLVCKQTCKVETVYTARRGTDVASLAMK